MTQSTQFKQDRKRCRELLNTKQFTFTTYRLIETIPPVVRERAVLTPRIAIEIDPAAGEVRVLANSRYRAEAERIRDLLEWEDDLSMVSYFFESRGVPGGMCGYVGAISKLERCEVPACDDFGAGFSVGQHAHSIEIAAGVALTLEDDGFWHVFVEKSGSPMAVEQATELSRAIESAALRVLTLNDGVSESAAVEAASGGRVLRRPVDYCAEPDLNGIGGGI